MTESLVAPCVYEYCGFPEMIPTKNAGVDVFCACPQRKSLTRIACDDDVDRMMETHLSVVTILFVHSVIKLSFYQYIMNTHSLIYRDIGSD